VSIYYLSGRRDTASAIERKRLCAHFTRPAHADGKSSLEGVLPIPRTRLFLVTSFCWLPNRPGPLSFLLFESSFSGLRFPQIMKLI